MRPYGHAPTPLPAAKSLTAGKLSPARKNTGPTCSVKSRAPVHATLWTSSYAGSDPFFLRFISKHDRIYAVVDTYLQTFRGLLITQI